MADPTIEEEGTIAFDTLTECLQSSLDERELSGEPLGDTMFDLHQDSCASNRDDDLGCDCLPISVPMEAVKRVGVRRAGDMLEAYTGLSPSGSPDG